ncbi:MAG: hypothetical protein RIC85_05265 [Gammaproteobacteria bacterium]|uniref:hypothetical protein n=1 Tax=Thalassobaculum sp. TaxID=2022740 RepID=UPI0032EB7E82
MSLALASGAPGFFAPRFPLAAFALMGDPASYLAMELVGSLVIEGESFSSWLAEERWPLKAGQVVKLFPSMRRTGLDGQGHAQAIHG